MKKLGVTTIVSLLTLSVFALKLPSSSTREQSDDFNQYFTEQLVLVSDYECSPNLLPLLPSLWVFKVKFCEF
jgi:hypothetical protein